MRGAATRLRPTLLAGGLAVDRLTNQRPYVQQQSVIQYRSGQQAAARRVADVLQTSAPIEVAPDDGRRPDVRVVLGHDWRHTVSCNGRSGCKVPMTVALLSPHP